MALNISETGAVLRPVAESRNSPLESPLMLVLSFERDGWLETRSRGVVLLSHRLRARSNIESLRRLGSSFVGAVAFSTGNGVG